MYVHHLVNRERGSLNNRGEISSLDSRSAATLTSWYRKADCCRRVENQNSINTNRQSCSSKLHPDGRRHSTGYQSTIILLVRSVSD
jgi:hypothetical protein